MAEVGNADSETLDVQVLASLARHLAFSPVALAVTEGPAHSIVYSNTAFRALLRQDSRRWRTQIAARGHQLVDHSIGPYFIAPNEP